MLVRTANTWIHIDTMSITRQSISIFWLNSIRNDVIILQGKIKLINKLERGFLASADKICNFVRIKPAAIRQKIVICKFNKFDMSTMRITSWKQIHCNAEIHWRKEKNIRKLKIPILYIKEEVMYLISLYFDEKTENRISGYMKQIAKYTGNTAMLDGNVPPHITIAAFHAE